MSVVVPPQTWVYIPDQSVMINVALSTVFWTVLYIIATFLPIPQIKAFKTSEGKPVQISKWETLDTQNRYISLIHGIMCIILSFYDITYLNLPCGSPNHPVQTFLITVSCGYFLYDLLAMMYYGLLDRSMLLHHGICILGYYLVLCFGASASELIAGVYISEVSNPFMHMRIISRNFGYRHTKFYEACEYIYILLYIYYRLLKGIFVVWNCAACQNGNHPIIRLLSVLLAVQSYFFIYKMVSILKGRFSEKAERDKVGVSLFWFNHNKDVEKLTYYKKSAKRDGIP